MLPCKKWTDNAFKCRQTTETTQHWLGRPPRLFRQQCKLSRNHTSARICCVAMKCSKPPLPHDWVVAFEILVCYAHHRARVLDSTQIEARAQTGKKRSQPTVPKKKKLTMATMGSCCLTNHHGRNVFLRNHGRQQAEDSNGISHVLTGGTGARTIPTDNIQHHSNNHFENIDMEKGAASVQEHLALYRSNAMLPKKEVRQLIHEPGGQQGVIPLSGDHHALHTIRASSDSVFGMDVCELVPTPEPLRTCNKQQDRAFHNVLRRCVDNVLNVLQTTRLLSISILTAFTL